jgi:translation initiation factor 3 subunit M
MNVPVFIEIGFEEQSEELRKYFKGLGADISLERCEDKREDVKQIISVCDACFKLEADSEIEGVLNGIVSMIPGLLDGDKEEFVLSFCEKLSKAPAQQHGMVALKVLWSLFMCLDDDSKMKFHVYYFLVKVAGETHQLTTVYKDMATVKQMFHKCPPTDEQMQKMYRLLHEMLLLNGRSDDAGRVMIELLGTYTTENASQAKEEAQRCIVASMADPHTFLMDHLLTLKPVKALEGQPIHQLLKIFVSEQLDSYVKFYEKNQAFVDGLGLKHQENLSKMRLLSFMQMAENRSEIPMAEMCTTLDIPENEIEDFLIDAIKTRLVRAKISQGDGVVYVSSTMHRTFSPSDWNQLYNLLQGWKGNLSTVKDHLSTIAATQVELMHEKN